jgi:hypothetical protein
LGAPTRVLIEPGAGMFVAVLLCAWCYAADPTVIAPVGSDHLFAAYPPLSQHPDNPHYLLFNNKPTILVTST